MNTTPITTRFVSVLVLAGTGWALFGDRHDQVRELQAALARVEDSLARERTRVDRRLFEVEQAAYRRDRHEAARIDALAARVAPDRRVLSNDMLLPTVQLNGLSAVGSGTLIYSRKNPATGRADNYVLTAWHVVRDILATDGDRVVATVYQRGERVEVPAELVAKNPRIDTALLRLSTERTFPHVARLASRDEHVAVWDAVYAVGCPLGTDPVPSSGAISSLGQEVGGVEYWMINAPTYFGNSGGGVYLRDGHGLVGVFSKVYTDGRGVITHMGLMTPITTIRSWLVAKQLSHLISPAPAESGPVAGGPWSLQVDR